MGGTQPVDRQAVNACIAKITELMKRMGSGEPRPVTDVLDDYDEFRRQVSVLADAGALYKAPYKDTRRIVREFIAQFDGNIEAIVTTRYNSARRDFDRARAAEHKCIIVRDAADELERLTQYPEHREHTLLKRVVIALREWEGKLAVSKGR
jgi:hypothetical protein